MKGLFRNTYSRSQ